MVEQSEHSRVNRTIIEHTEHSDYSRILFILIHAHTVLHLCSCVTQSGPTSTAAQHYTQGSFPGHCWIYLTAMHGETMAVRYMALERARLTTHHT